MAETYIIVQSDILKYHPMATVPQERINPYILKAQELDLKPIMNESLYYDFITKFRNTDDPMCAAYQNILKGTTYIYSGQTIEFPGIIPMMCAFVMSRFIPVNQVNVTSYGVTNKLNPQSEPTTLNQITYLVNNLKGEAMAYQNQLEKFLQQNQTTYPLYGTFPSAVQTRVGVKFSNSASYGSGYRGWWNGNYYY